MAVILSAAARAQEVTVFAAASLGNALTEAGRVYADKTGGAVRMSFAASSVLAKQIENGAPGDVFISADAEWMEYLAAQKLVVAATRVTLFGNALVVVAPADTRVSAFALESGRPLAERAGEGRIAMGDPDHVPVGKYAKQAFERLGQWSAIAPRLARTDNARTALALVERGEAPFGIVYASDAAASGKVRVVAHIAEALHEPVVYPAALVAGRDSEPAKAFLAFLSGPEARAIFARHGFRVPEAGKGK